MLQLVILSGRPRNAAVPLAGDSIAVGREHDNVIQLADDQVSRHHAVLVRNGGNYILRDLGSINGSFVNGAPAKETPLKPGDRIRFGETEFRYESLPDGESADAVKLTELARRNEGLMAELSVARRQLADARRQVSGPGALNEDQRKSVLATAEPCVAELPRVNKELVARLSAAGAERYAPTQRVAVADPAELERLRAELAEARQHLEKTKDLESRVAQLTKENDELADELEKVRRETAEAHQRFAEQVAEEMKNLRRDSAAGPSDSAPMAGFDSQALSLPSLTPADVEPLSPRRRRGMGLTLLGVAVFIITVLAAVFVLSHR